MRFFFSPIILLLLLSGSMQAQTLIIRQAYGQEGCRDARAVLLRNGASGTLSFALSYTGSASSGFDYTSNLSGTVSMPPSVDSLEILLTPVSDGIVEFTETVTITATGGSSPLTATLSLLDAVRVYAGADTTACTGQPLTIGSSVHSTYPCHWTSTLIPSGLSSSTAAQPVVQLSLNQTTTATYIVTATDTTGCTGIDSITLQFIVFPSFSITIKDSLCEHETTLAAYTGPSDTTYQYTWDFGASSSSPAVNQSSTTASWSMAGLYPVVLQVAVGGCSATATQSVLVSPSFQVTIQISDSQICNNEGVTLNASLSPSVTNPTYIWDIDNAAGGGNTEQVSATWSIPGPKVIHLQVIAMGCSQVVQDTVMVDSVPIVDFALPETTCIHSPTLVTYTGDTFPGTTYHWKFFFGTSSPPVSSSSPGSYTVSWDTAGTGQVLVWVQAKCPSYAKVKAITVRPDSSPATDILPILNQCIANNSFSFQGQSAEPGSTYTWSFGPNASLSNDTSASPGNITFSQPGTKQAILQITTNGCLSVPDTAVFDVLPQPALPVLSFDNDSTLTVSATNGPAIAQWSWFYGNVPLATTPDSTLHISQNGLYQVVATSTDGCVSDTATLQVLNVQTDEPSAVNLRIYPNPTTGMLFLEGATAAEITLFSPGGQQVLHADRTTALDLSGLPAGVYLVHIRTESGTAHARITKQ